MIITISGTPGSGKSTVARHIAKVFNLKHYSMGDLQGEIAQKKGMTLYEHLKSGETDPSVDKDVDEYLKKLGETEDGFVADCRLGYLFVPQSLKIFTTCSFEVGVQRIFKNLQEGGRQDEGTFNSEEEVSENLKKRMETDTKRYQQYYNTNPWDESNYDIVLDTTDLNAEEGNAAIIKLIEDFQNAQNQ